MRPMQGFFKASAHGHVPSGRICCAIRPEQRRKVLEDCFLCSERLGKTITEKQAEITFFLSNAAGTRVCPVGPAMATRARAPSEKAEAKGVDNRKAHVFR